jgi:hypothetical protein
MELGTQSDNPSDIRSTLQILDECEHLGLDDGNTRANSERSSNARSPGQLKAVRRPHQQRPSCHPFVFVGI